MKQLQDRTAVVTGAGSGIGRALALELADRGCHLALADVVEDRLGPVGEAVEQRGRRVSLHGLDVADRHAWPGFLEAVRREHGAAHLLVNNAGISLTGPFEACTLDDLERVLDVNLRGVMYGCHTFLPELRQHDEAHLVNVSSIFGIVSMPEQSAYCMAKHGARALSETLELELWDTPVRVSSVHPGAVATRIVADGGFSGGGRFSPNAARKAIEQGIEPAAAARIIADGIQRNVRRIIVGRDATWLARVQHALPVGYRDLVHWYTTRRRRRR